MGNEPVSRLLLQGAEYLAEVHLQAASVMERLVASVDAQPSTRLRLMLSGIGVYGNVNVSDYHPHGSALESESERVKGVENGIDYERPAHEDAPPKIFRSKEGEGCASLSVNESGSARLSASEGANSRLESECVNDYDRGDHANAHVRDGHDHRHR